MKTRKFTFYFQGGKITVRAFDAEQGKILAQAKAIENGWDHTIVKKPNIKKLNMYINWDLLSEDERCTLDLLLCKAKVNEE